ncbi:MAG: ubiquinone/menaquinone biosynthesis methyltransferase [Candidatus Aminicenantales bacterium]
MSKGLRKIFSEVSSRYELINHLLTFGGDIIWRRKAARIALLSGGKRWLDVCSGTGEMARNLILFSRSENEVVALDFCPPMLKKAVRKSGNWKLWAVIAEANSLPFADDYFDGLTISFATRNITPRKGVLINHLKEFWRVLKPGGCFINLETSQPPSTYIRHIFHFYVRLAVRPVGFMLSGSKAGYGYLASTIPKFYPAEELASLLYQVGFRCVSYRRLFFGVSAIHKALK